MGLSKKSAVDWREFWVGVWSFGILLTIAASVVLVMYRHNPPPVVTSKSVAINDWSIDSLMIPAIHAQPGFQGSGVKVGIADYGGRHGDVVTYVCRRIAPDATILFYDMVDPNSADGAGAIRWLADRGCDVINCSWYSERYHEPLDYAIRYAIDRGCVVVFGAGNSGHGLPPYWPSSMHAHLPGVVQVGSYNQLGQVSFYSSGGINVQCTFPGEDLLVPDRTSGTSLAAPGVSAVISLGIGWRSANNKRKLAPSEIYDLIGPNLTTSRCLWPPSFLSAMQWR